MTSTSNPDRSRNWETYPRYRPNTDRVTVPGPTALTSGSNLLSRTAGNGKIPSRVLT
jgi:hypothetical protein